MENYILRRCLGKRCFCRVADEASRLIMWAQIKNVRKAVSLIWARYAKWRKLYNASSNRISRWANQTKKKDKTEMSELNKNGVGGSPRVCSKTHNIGKKRGKHCLTQDVCEQAAPDGDKIWSNTGQVLEKKIYVSLCMCIRRLCVLCVGIYGLLFVLVCVWACVYVCMDVHFLIMHPYAVMHKEVYLNEHLCSSMMWATDAHSCCLE